MFQAIAIGYIGSPAEVKTANGNQFTTFRIAHSDRWKDDAGNVHESTQWIDVTINGKPAVFEYLQRGTLVYVTGAVSTRIYSSAKDRCMKAGVTIAARSIELLGGRQDDIPARLYDMDGAEHQVTKYYNVATLVRDKKQPEFIPMQSRAGDKFTVDRQGWVQRFVEPTTQEHE